MTLSSCFCCPAGLERFKALLQTKALFQRYAGSGELLRSTLDRLTVLEGDVHRKDCGLCAADLARLRADVDIVIHSAASISFFEHVHVLLQQNYQASNLCNTCVRFSSVDSLNFGLGHPSGCHHGGAYSRTSSGG